MLKIKPSLMFKKHVLFVAIIIMLSGMPIGTIQAKQLVVLELFTSQGCSSCPPADALLKQLSASDISLLPLSFHIHYWDNLGWKDPYSSVANTERQKRYAAVLGLHEIFTPQLIVNGTASVIGSNERDVNEAVTQAKKLPSSIDVAIKSGTVTGDLAVTLSAKDDHLANGNADIWEIHFNRYAQTNVSAGENGGRTLESINNVTSLKQIGVWPRLTHFIITSKGQPEDGIAIIVQAQSQGKILGAGAYAKDGL